MKTTSTEQLILGILSEGPEYGYRIEGIIEKRDMRKWADIGFSSIYYVRKKLKKKGRATAERSRGREKKRYFITESGKESLREETRRQIAERRPSNTHLMTGLANSHCIGDEEWRLALEERRRQLAWDYAALQKKLPLEEEKSPSAGRLFRLSERLLRAELDFVEGELERMEGKG